MNFQKPLLQEYQLLSMIANLKNIKRVAILRANAVGDFIVTLPAIQALRAQFPEAELVLLGRPWHQQFLIPGRTPIDRVIVVPVMQGIRNEKDEEENVIRQNHFFEQIKNEEFDIAIHFQGNGISANPFLKKLGARLTVGIAGEGADPLDLSIPFYYYQSEVIRYLEVVSLLGAKNFDWEPRLTVLREDEVEIESIGQVLDQKPFVVLNAFAADKRRAWPPENYARLADELKRQGFEIVFTGSAEEKQGVEKIMAAMKYPALNTCGKLSLGGLAALLKSSALVISGDTGPLHLARAVNTPTVGLYWAPNLINWGPLSRNIHRPVVSWQMECPYCGVIPNDPYPFEPQNGCKHDVSFVRDITVEQVLKQSFDLLCISSKKQAMPEEKNLNFLKNQL